MCTKESFFADFLTFRGKDEMGISLHLFFQKMKNKVNPRALIILLNELNKEGEVVVTARVWPPVGQTVHREVVTLPLNEWLGISPDANRKLYFYADTGRWFDVPPSTDSCAYDNFMLYVTKYGLPTDVRAKMEDERK